MEVKGTCRSHFFPTSEWVLGSDAGVQASSKFGAAVSPAGIFALPSAWRDSLHGPLLRQLCVEDFGGLCAYIGIPSLVTVSFRGFCT